MYVTTADTLAVKLALIIVMALIIVIELGQG